MPPPIHRPQAPRHSTASIVHQMQHDRTRAKSAPFQAAYWLTALSIPAPFIVGNTLASHGSEIFALIMLALAIVLFVRAAIVRGIITILLACLFTFWLHDGALITAAILHQKGIITTALFNRAAR